MNIPVFKKSIVLGGAIAPLRKSSQEKSVEGMGANQVVGIHAPPPMVGGEILDKLKFSKGKTSKRENIKFIF